MAGAGYKLFTAGAVLTAAEVNTYLEQQTVMVFASAAARTTALSGVLAEGLLTQTLDTNSLAVYSGSAWSTIGPVHGAWTSFTPTVTQSGAVTVTVTSSYFAVVDHVDSPTVTSASYQRIGRTITGNFILTVTGSGTGANAVVISALPATAASGQQYVGSGSITDATGPQEYFANLQMNSTTTFVFRNVLSSTTNAWLGASGFTAALANTDSICGFFEYQASGDA